MRSILNSDLKVRKVDKKIIEIESWNDFFLF